MSACWVDLSPPQSRTTNLSASGRTPIGVVAPGHQQFTVSSSIEEAALRERLLDRRSRSRLRQLETTPAYLMGYATEPRPRNPNGALIGTPPTRSRWPAARSRCWSARGRNPSLVSACNGPPRRLACWSTGNPLWPSRGGMVPMDAPRWPAPQRAGRGLCRVPTPQTRPHLASQS